MCFLSFRKGDSEKELSQDEDTLVVEAPDNGIANVTASAEDDRRLSRVRHHNCHLWACHTIEYTVT